MASFVSLAIFILLITLSASRLITLKREVADVEKQLAQKSVSLESKSAELKEIDSKLAVLRELYSKMAEENPRLARSATKAVLEADPKAAEILPRVYIHIRSEAQRASATALGEALEQDGFVVPGIERLVDVGPNDSELRYFQATELAVADAGRAAAVLSDAGLRLQPKFVPGYEESTEIRARHYELWLAPDFGAAR